jgi:hypothetical protein
MTDAEALEMVREWWKVGALATTMATDAGFKPRLEPTRYGWSVCLYGWFETANCFDGPTIAEAVQRAQPYAEMAMKTAREALAKVM